MQNNWTLNGTQLASIGFVTLLDGYLDIPAKRGDNILVPFNHGKIYVPKFYDSKTISFGMEIVGTDIADVDDRMDKLKALLGGMGQGILANSNFPGGARQALVELAGTLAPTRDDPLVVTIVITFLMAEPFFRGLVAIDKSITINANPTAYTLAHPGSAPETKAIVKLTGPLSHPVITNSTTGSVMQYDDVLANNTHIITIDCGAFTAIDQASVNQISKIIHTGDFPFLSLAPSNNVLSIADGTHTTGIVEIKFYPPWL